MAHAVAHGDKAVGDVEGKQVVDVEGIHGKVVLPIQVVDVEGIRGEDGAGTVDDDDTVGFITATREFNSMICFLKLSSLYSVPLSRLCIPSTFDEIWDAARPRWLESTSSMSAMFTCSSTSMQSKKMSLGREGVAAGVEHSTSGSKLQRTNLCLAGLECRTRTVL